jgi:hypothetical protein
MSKNDLNGDALERQLEGLRAKADAYHRLSLLARELVQDLSIATKADEAARSHEEAMYERARWHARDLAIACGHSGVAECVLYEMDVDDQLVLPTELKEAIRRWHTLSRFRPNRETPV